METKEFHKYKKQFDFNFKSSLQRLTNQTSVDELSLMENEELEIIYKNLYREN